MRNVYGNWRWGGQRTTKVRSGRTYTLTWGREKGFFYFAPLFLSGSRLFFTMTVAAFCIWEIKFLSLCYFFPGAFFVGPCSPRSKGGGGGGGSSNFVSSSNSYWGYEESAAGEEEEESEEDNGNLFSHMEINFAPVRYIPYVQVPRWRYQHL